MLSKKQIFFICEQPLLIIRLLLLLLTLLRHRNQNVKINIRKYIERLIHANEITH